LQNQEFPLILRDDFITIWRFSTRSTLGIATGCPESIFQSCNRSPKNSQRGFAAIIYNSYAITRQLAKKTVNLCVINAKPT